MIVLGIARAFKFKSIFLRSIQSIYNSYSHPRKLTTSSCQLDSYRSRSLKMVDYSKWDKLVVSSDEEQDKDEEREAYERMQREAAIEKAKKKTPQPVPVAAPSIPTGETFTNTTEDEAVLALMGEMKKLGRESNKAPATPSTSSTSNLLTESKQLDEKARAELLNKLGKRPGKSMPKTTTSRPASAQALPEKIPAVIIRCNADADFNKGKYFWQNTTISPADLKKGFVAPMWAQKLKLPIVVIRHRPAGKPAEVRFDNKPATWMMIEPISGFASQDWQSAVGTVTIARQDGKFFDVITCGILHEFNSLILDAFADSQADGHALMNPKSFERFFMEYDNKPADLPCPYRVWALLFFCIVHNYPGILSSQSNTIYFLTKLPMISANDTFCGRLIVSWESLSNNL